MNKIIDGLPATSYTDPAVYQAERQLIFARNWQYAAHESELPQAGSFVALDIAGFPLMLVKQNDGTVACFQNICRHRGAPLVSSGCGSVQNGALTCKYHGWSYSCGGDLLAVPHLDEMTDAARKDLSLIRVATATYRGMIFVNLSPSAADANGTANDASFNKSFAELIQTVNASDCDLENYSFHSTTTREGNFNWKVWVEGYQECYHCPTIHPIFNKDFWLKKYSVENRDHFSLHSCERKSPSTSGEFSGLWLWVYPNLGMPIYQPCFYTLRVNPLAVDRTVLSYTFHRRNGVDDSTMDEFRRFVDSITDEDISICEAVQKNLASGLVEKTRLNAQRENGVAYFHSLVREQLGNRSNAVQLV